MPVSCTPSPHALSSHLPLQLAHRTSPFMPSAGPLTHCKHVAHQTQLPAQHGHLCLTAGEDPGTSWGAHGQRLAEAVGEFWGSRAGCHPRRVRPSDVPKLRWGPRQTLRPERGSTPDSEVAMHPGTARVKGSQGGLGSECSKLGHTGSPSPRSQGQGQELPPTAPGHMALLPKEGRVGRKSPERSASWMWAPCRKLPSSALWPREGRDPPKVTQQASARLESDPRHQVPSCDRRQRDTNAAPPHTQAGRCPAPHHGTCLSEPPQHTLDLWMASSPNSVSYSESL